MKPFGKKRCEILKGIRTKIAKANGIKYTPVKCTHEGDCPGTCPQCEAEVQYIEQELKQKFGTMQKAASVLVGSTITVGALSMVSCKPRIFHTTGIEPAQIDTVIEIPDREMDRVMGEPPVHGVLPVVPEEEVKTDTLPNTK